MKKRLLTMILFGTIFLSLVTGCSNNMKEESNIDDNQQENNSTDIQQDKSEIYNCLENELGAYILTEKDDLKEIPLSEVKKSDSEKIEYYKGVYASKHPDNMYVIVYPENGTYDYYVMKDFDKYFYDKFSVYQKSETPSSPTIYIHNTNKDVDFNEILNKCIKGSNYDKGNSISSKTINKIKDTEKIVIKSNKKVLGTITDKDKLKKVISAISDSKQYGDAFLCDGHGFDFEMYGKNNKLIDTIYIWGDGKRLLPKSISGKGCSYYSVTNDADFRKIIEDETDYVFYGLLDFRDDDKQKSQLIYKDDKNSYYLKGKNPNEVLIKFTLNNQVMTLKYALENKLISPEKVISNYPNILIKE